MGKLLEPPRSFCYLYAIRYSSSPAPFYPPLLRFAMHHLRFRQVHLDFHTSPFIEGIGTAFQKEKFQQALLDGHVDSITLFSKCHHGLSYHPTSVGIMHPHLTFDLLRAQMDACKEIGVATPVYLSAGFDQEMARKHPEWRVVRNDGKLAPHTEPGFAFMCFNTGYLDYLCEQIKEAVRLFPDANGIFLDITEARDCCCATCVQEMLRQGLDPNVWEDREKHRLQVQQRYFERTTEAVRSANPNMPVFHNFGNMVPFKGKNQKFFSHFELESLPTGGWGYDHFPLSALYIERRGYDFLGMTGKFNYSWGEFGGLKHPNALRYECAAMLAFGAKCSIGDQCHPDGHLEPGTYRTIGAAYAEVEQKEPWCTDTRNRADVGLILAESCRCANGVGARTADFGASRILLEEHILFDVLDLDYDFSPYKLIVVPDCVLVDPALKAKLDAYLAGGGRLLFSGDAGFSESPEKRGVPDRFLFDAGAEIGEMSPFLPDYVLPAPDCRASYMDSPMVMYTRSRRVRVTDGEALGDVFDPYFNRSFPRFCSHQHTPYAPNSTGFAAAVIKGNVAYIAHRVFAQYADRCGVTDRTFVAGVIRRLLPDAERSVSLPRYPSSARVTLRTQPRQNREILHLFYAEKNLRGGIRDDGVLANYAYPIEVIENLCPLRNVDVKLNTGKPVASVRLVPSGEPPESLSISPDGREISFTVPELLCHQMVEVAYR